jgi:general secretion pathway protein F
MRFVVRALAPGNKLETLHLEALDLADAQREAERRRLDVVSLSQDKPVARAQRDTFAVTLFCQELCALLDAGLSVVEALEGMLEKEPSTTGRTVIAGLLTRLRDGQRLSSAIREQSDVFPTLLLGLVQSAEGTSDLPGALRRYVEYSQRVEQTRARIISASIYPTVLLLVGGCVSLFLMGYVVPRFAQVYHGSGRALPWMSQLLLDWGQWVGQNAGQAATAFALLVGGTAFFLVRAWRSSSLLSYASRLPAVGPWLRASELSRLYLTLGTLVEGGIAVRSALEMVAAAASPSLRRSLTAVRSEITQGQSLSVALDATGLSTPISGRLIRAGERSGELGSMLMRAAQFHEAELARTVERFSKLFEPLLMAGIGIVIGLIVILLYMPIFDLVGSFG